MERLTSKETREKITNRLMPYQFNADVTITQKQFFDMYDKLLAFEDFMEKNDLQELEQLQEIIERDKFNYLITAPLEKENQTLKGNWEKLREWVWDKEPLFKGANAIFKTEILGKMRELESADGEL